MGKPYPHKQQCVYLPTLEELEEERNDLLQANQNGVIVVDALCEKIRDQRGEINGLKCEIRRLRREIGERDRLIEKLQNKKDKGDE
ncbi:MAG: hypothetical protein J5958_06710 [Clostridia bacterium]|nr:hypothetical protein [Clostridia bacterium]